MPIIHINDKKLAPQTRNYDPLAIQHLVFLSENFAIELSDGRVITVPYWWFPRLAEASIHEREAYRIELEGQAIWWEKIDDGLTLEALLEGKADVSAFAVQWRKERDFSWFDEWLEQRMTTDQRTILETRSKRWAAMDT